MKSVRAIGHEPKRIVIIGGGPGGVACALAMQRLAAQMNRSMKIIIIEGKQFAGEQHYNQCVGVLSPPLPSLLEDQLGVPFPYHLSRGEIKGYFLHTANEHIKVADDDDVSFALRRVQFDAYMSETAQKRGIEIFRARAIDLEFHPEFVVVYTENSPIECDVVVGAFGMDEGTAAIFTRQTGYKPPRALSSVVTKYHPDANNMAEFGPNIHAFLPANPQIEFGGITPKGNHLAVNIAGKSVDSALMRAFLNQPTVGCELPDLNQAGKFDPHDLRFFKGRFPCSLAKKYYGNRYVMVGDASGLVRAFKGKGVTSAVLTGIRAADTILKAGFSKQAFQNHYRQANLDIIRDLPFGQAMRQITILLSRYKLLDPVIRAAKRETNLEFALLGAISAHAPYRQVMLRALHPSSIMAILRAMLIRSPMEG